MAVIEYLLIYGPNEPPPRCSETSRKNESKIKEIAGVLDGDDEDVAHLMDKYDLEMDFDSVPGLCERFGLNYP